MTVSTSNGVITVSRLLPNGAPDPTFGDDGEAIIESEGFPSAYALAVQSDGKIVLAGFRNVGATGENATVWRLQADGGSGTVNSALDPTFGTGGVVEISTFTHTVADAVAIQPDGKIVVAGRGFNATGPNTVAVWRLTTSGALDPSFDTDGTAEISDGSEDLVNAIALQPDGKIVLAGSTGLATTPSDAVVWRLKANGGSGALDGALDTTFDSDGQADVDAGGDETASAVALQPDGKIVIAGYTEGGPLGSDAMVWRLNAERGDEQHHQRRARPELRHRRRRLDRWRRRLRESRGARAAARREDTRRRGNQDRHGPVHGRRLAACLQTVARALPTARSTPRSGRAAPRPSAPGRARARTHSCCSPIAGSLLRARPSMGACSCSGCSAIRSP